MSAGELRRGEIWKVVTVGQERLVLIVQSDALMMVSPGFLVAPMYTQPPPARSLIAPEVQGLYADLSDTGRLLASRFKEHCYTATEDEMAAVNTGLRAVLDLL